MLACFQVINITTPTNQQLKRIFGTLLSHHLADFDEVVKPLGESVTSATIDIYRAVAAELLPTPSKSHYLFNTRDLAKVIQGVMQADKNFTSSRSCRIRKQQLWSSSCSFDETYTTSDLLQKKK